MKMSGNSFHSVIQVWRTLNTRYWKTLSSTAGCLPRYATELRTESALHFLHFYRPEWSKNLLAYVFFDINDLKFLKKATWPRRTRATVVQENSNTASVESKWDFSFASIESGVASGYFAAPKAEVKHRVYLVLEGFARYVWLPQRVLQKALGAAFVPSKNVSRVVYARVQIAYRKTSKAF